jgi:hypothetical protein
MPTVPPTRNPGALVRRIVRYWLVGALLRLVTVLLWLRRARPLPMSQCSPRRVLLRD